MACDVILQISFKSSTLNTTITVVRAPPTANMSVSWEVRGRKGRIHDLGQPFLSTSLLPAMWVEPPLPGRVCCHASYLTITGNTTAKPS